MLVAMHLACFERLKLELAAAFACVSSITQAFPMNAFTVGRAVVNGLASGVHLGIARRKVVRLIRGLVHRQIFRLQDGGLQGAGIEV
jgi:hypothetical protein